MAVEDDYCFSLRTDSLIIIFLHVVIELLLSIFLSYYAMIFLGISIAALYAILKQKPYFMLPQIILQILTLCIPFFGFISLIIMGLTSEYTKYWFHSIELTLYQNIRNVLIYIFLLLLLHYCILELILYFGEVVVNYYEQLSKECMQNVPNVQNATNNAELGIESNNVSTVLPNKEDWRTIGTIQPAFESKGHF